MPDEELQYSGTMRLGPGSRKKTFVRLTLESHVLTAGAKTLSHTRRRPPTAPAERTTTCAELFAAVAGPPAARAKQPALSPRALLNAARHGLLAS